ncbi:Alg14-domain-containing protein [Dacryopinax primogenitus]|uniref:UDP-N-acetylglucosamine transferase subunit ALG14 n=1 Tax=Dacryopinax primogenitus (strain DJM 731) TaxID=1858805 RepID=M5FWQ5_DACPD|nr:Alg14-domain-containing protein [Dacryopinax primogenitus]EJU00120.1 Alg14-domain-containing protein [Dacryopinax primogenitus]
MVISLLSLLLLLVLIVIPVRAYAILLPNRPKPRTGPSKLAVFLGSGGHTSESLQLLRALPFTRYYPRLYITSSLDTLSIQKATSLESSLAPSLPPHAQQHTFLVLPRARRVHQPFWATPPTAIWSLVVAVWELSIRPALRGQACSDLLLLNGPGTCVPLLAAVYTSKFLALPAPRTIYVESFARVSSLSLSAKLVRPFVDRFVVQWPQAMGKGRGECRGWLV